MEHALIIAKQAIIMFILLFVGFFLYKKKMMSEETTKQLSKITLSIVNPIVIFNSYQMDFEPKLLTGLLIATALAVGAHLIMIGFSRLAVRKGQPDGEIERFAAIYSNCGFLGIPLVQATFGSEGVFYLTGYITVFNLFMWTHGVIIMHGGSSSEEKTSPAKSLLKILLSPAIIAIMLGLVFFFTGLRLPEIVQTPLDYLGSMNTPLAMLVSGATIAKAGLLKAFKCPRVYIIQLFKLVIVPVVLALLFAPLGFVGVDTLITNVVLIAAAAPTASATVMFAYTHGRDAEYASNHFALSTLASMATLPLTLMLSALLSSLIM